MVMLHCPSILCCMLSVVHHSSTIFMHLLWNHRADRSQFSSGASRDGGRKVCLWGLCLMTKMITMPIYGKNPSKIFIFGTVRPMTLKLGIKHLVLGPIIVCSNGNSGFTIWTKSEVFQPNLGPQKCETSNYCQTNMNSKEGILCNIFQ